jgi:hypothetical protein
MAGGPRFSHVDDETWQVVRQLKRGDEVLSVREKWLDFGPFVAGPEGVVMLEVMMGDPRSFPARQEEWQRLLQQHGMERVPNPPIDLPEWLEDARN